MHVHIFDTENEIDLEIKVNELLAQYNDIDIIDIKYSVACAYDEREQIYCFSCMILCRD